MSANYELFENPNPRNDGKKQPLHARVIPVRTVRLERICEEISNYSSFSSGDIRGILQLLSDQIVMHLKNGENLELEGIGNFSVSVTSPKEMERKKINASRIRFKTVKFKCCKSIRKRLHAMTFKPLPIEYRHSHYTDTKRRNNILSYLEEKKIMQSSHCMEINHCSRYMALKDLEELIKEGKIVKLGKYKTVMYRLPETPQPDKTF